ncbi:hypothetical protein E4U37_003789 [Claviceps purpurea]|nr:hypothetical protein E4U37_003789 [Claviceps purpurea]
MAKTWSIRDEHVSWTAPPPAPGASVRCVRRTRNRPPVVHLLKGHDGGSRNPLIRVILRFYNICFQLFPNLNKLNAILIPSSNRSPKENKEKKDIMAPHTYEFNVTMTCGGCSGAIERVLSRMEGIESYDVSLDTQTARVVTGLPYEDVLAKIAKTGKKVNSATADGEARSVEVS